MEDNKTEVKQKTVFEVLSAIDVNEHVEKKKTGQKNPDGSDVELSYLSWMWAWSYVKKLYPDANYRVIMNENNLPYFSDPKIGAMVYTEVTIQGETLSMWLPVMDGANNAMKDEAYDKVTTSKFGTKTKHIEGIDMTNVNKTVMRCLAKNLAMFGLGSYIYAGEDLPEESDEAKTARLEQEKKEADEIKNLIDDIANLIDIRIKDMTADQKKAFNNNTIVPVVECKNYTKCKDKDKLMKLKAILEDSQAA